MFFVLKFFSIFLLLFSNFDDPTDESWRDDSLFSNTIALWSEEEEINSLSEELLSVACGWIELPERISLWNSFETLIVGMSFFRTFASKLWFRLNSSSPKSKDLFGFSYGSDSFSFAFSYYLCLRCFYFSYSSCFCLIRESRIRGSLFFRNETRSLIVFM